MLRNLFLLSGMFIAALSAGQTQVVRVPLPHSSFPISQGVWVGGTYYLSGTADPSAGKSGSTTTAAQTAHAVAAIKEALAVQNLTLGDIVMMRVYLAPDRTRCGKCDFAGFMAGYTQFFGTADQPNKPARSVLQAGALVIPGGLVEIEVVAARPK